MPKLATAVDVRNRRKTLNAGANQSIIDAAIEDALEGTTLYLEGVLNTNFDKVARTHVYDVNIRQKPTTNQFTELFLKAGIVDIGEPISVKVGSVLEDLATETDLIVDVDFVVSAEPGIILLNHGSLTNAFSGQVLVPQLSSLSLGNGENFLARITYTSGIAVDGGDPTLFDVTLVPSWLKEAAVLHALITLDTQSPVVKPEYADKIREKQKPIWNSLRGIIDKHERYFGATVKPLYDI